MISETHQMHLCIVGGIFGKDRVYRQKVTNTPETNLVAGLRSQGHHVEARSHFGPYDFDEFDAVHVHHLSYASVVAAATANSRMVFTPHWLPEVGGRFAHESAAWRRPVMRYVTRRAARVVALSGHEAERTAGLYGVDDSRLRVIANGIDDQLFPYVSPRRELNDSGRLLYVGQLSRHKGVHILLEALSLMQGPSDLQLDLIYQIGVEEQALRTQARNLGLRNVHFRGTATPGEVSKALAGCDLLVLPSFQEALPTVVTEALFVGRPVVATEAGAISEQYLGHGALVRPNDPRALAGALSSVLDGYGEYALRSQSISARARHRYAMPRMIEDHERLYREVATLPRHRTPGGRFVARMIEAGVRGGPARKFLKRS